MASAALSESRQSLLTKLYELFRQKGYDGVSIGDISAATGLGRSSLYHHFPGGKAEMAEAVVALAREVMTREFFEPLRENEPIETRIDRMIGAIDRVYVSGAGPCVLASLISASREGPLAEGLARLFEDWVAAIADALVSGGRAREVAEERALSALALVQGGLVLARGLRRPDVFPVALEKARGALLA